MSEKPDIDVVAQEIYRVLKGHSPLVAAMGLSGKNQILLGRDGQRWLVTVQEIPHE